MGDVLFIGKNNQLMYLDKFYEYGDLVFFGQVSYYHEVKGISTERNHNGRLHFYFPAITYGYMKTSLRFENYPFKTFCSEELNSYQKARKFLGALSGNDIRYSLQTDFKHFNN